MSVLQKYLSGSSAAAAVTPQPAAPGAAPPAPHSAPVAATRPVAPALTGAPSSQPHRRAYTAQQPAAAAAAYSSDSDQGLASGAGPGHGGRAVTQGTGGNDMDMSPILGQDQGAEADAKAAADAKALAKLPAQVGSARAGATMSARVLGTYAECTGCRFQLI